MTKRPFVRATCLGCLVLGACVPGPSDAPRPDTPAGPSAAAATASALVVSSALASALAPPAPPTAAPTASAEAPPPPEDEKKLPAGFVRGPVDRGARTQCGSFEIELAGGPDRAVPFVRVFDEQGKKVYEAHGRRMAIEPGVYAEQWLDVGWCGDLTGDGVPELFLSESTMGAHCCYTYYLVSLTRPAKTLLMWEKGDGGFGMTPEKIRPGKAWQVVSYHMVVPPFDAEQNDPVIAGYAGMPFYPIVFDLVGNEYRARTLSFPGWLAAERRKDREACAKNDSCGDSVFYDWGLSLMIGDWDKERAAITDEVFRKSFDRHAPEMTRRLRMQLGR